MTASTVLNSNLQGNVIFKKNEASCPKRLEHSNQIYRMSILITDSMGKDIKNETFDCLFSNISFTPYY